MPDYVVFYDGANDGYGGAYSPAVPRDPLNLRVHYMNEERFTGWTKLIVNAFDRTNYELLLDYVMRKIGSDPQKHWDADIEGRVDINARAVVELYEAPIRRVRALSREYGFKSLFF